MRLRWYGHLQRMKEHNEVRAIVCIIVPGKRMDGVRRDICRNCGSPRRMPRTEHSGNQEFGPLTLRSGKRRKRRTIDNGHSADLDVSKHG